MRSTVRAPAAASAPPSAAAAAEAATPAARETAKSSLSACIEPARIDARGDMGAASAMGASEARERRKEARTRAT